MPVSHSPQRLSIPLVFLIALLSARPARAVYVEPALNPVDAETPWRFIGVLNGMPPCPAALAPGWAVRPLFPATLWPYAPELARFCVYEWVGPGPFLPFASPPGFAQVYPDRMAVAPAAGTTSPGLWEALEATFVEHAGAAALPVASGGSVVRLALVDTSPTLGTNPDLLPETSVHGQTLQTMMRRLLCGGSGCVAEVWPRLALAYTAFTPRQGSGFTRNVQQGGHFGTIAELAEAIGAELDDWLASGSAKPPLVMNLSVAWDPVYGGQTHQPQQMLPDVQAVYRAIAAASCQGAIVVAAAGNLADRRGSNSGPMFPAAWARHLLALDPFCALAGSPMLFAAGGVRADGAPLTNARPRSAPIFAVYGDHAVIENPDDPGTPTPILTGSSVAAMVLSATAAAVAHYRPELSPAQVMDAVASSAHPLGRNADVCASSASACSVGYVSLCAAAHQACAGEPCLAQVPACVPRSFLAASLPEGSLGNPATTPEILAGDFLESYPSTQACQNELPLFLPGAEPTDPCPSFQRYGSAPRPWTVPQPNQDPCPNCIVIKRRDQPTGGASNPETGTFYLDLDPDFQGRLSDATLTLCPGPSAVVYDLGTGEDLGTLKLTGLAMSDCDEALLSFTLDGEQSLIIPVLVSE